MTTILDRAIAHKWAVGNKTIFEFLEEELINIVHSKNLPKTSTSKTVFCMFIDYAWFLESMYKKTINVGDIFIELGTTAVQLNDERHSKGGIWLISISFDNEIILFGLNYENSNYDDYHIWVSSKDTLETFQNNYLPLLMICYLTNIA